MLADHIRYVRESWEDMAFFALVVLTAGLLMFELTALFSTPVPDSYLWWGDESWLMLEFKSQITTGIFRHPYALASTLGHGSGAVFSNMWITALLYGGAATLFKTTNIIVVGRALTALLATGLVFALYEIIRKLTGDRLLAIFSVLLMISSRSFFFTSHSARYDILTASAIAVGFYLFLSVQLDNAKKAFVASVLIASGILISIHVVLALMIAGGVALVIDARRKAFALAAYVVGGGCIAAIILVLSAVIGNPGSSSSSGFALNIHDIPALRIYSRSVQFANITQRFSTFSSVALGYLILIAIALITFVVQSIRQKYFHVTRGIWLTLAITLSWLEFESAAPTSYLIYLLPTLSIAIALGLQRSAPKYIRVATIAIAALCLTFFAVQDDWRARQNGKKLNTANDEAVSAALAAIEGDTTHPVVLAFNPAVQRVVMDTSVQLMTTHFVEYPSTSDPIDSVIKQQHVKYVMLYRSTRKPDYMREAEPINQASKRLGVLVWERPGLLTDIGRSYFAKDTTGMDTLQIYRIRD